MSREGASTALDLFVADRLDMALAALERYKNTRHYINLRAHDAEGFKRELRRDEKLRIEAAAIEARDALREVLR